MFRTAQSIGPHDARHLELDPCSPKDRCTEFWPRRSAAFVPAVMLQGPAAPGAVTLNRLAARFGGQRATSSVQTSLYTVS